ncbi:MAG: RluA family pseudouridine synthase [Alcanivorax sp.]|nr:RluA family pseudouridine synthase [Alcanivorax sp.]
MTAEIAAEVLYRHADFLALNKPAGASMHSEDGPGWVVSISQALGEPVWPVHRLDRATSGLVLLARHRDAAAALGELFAGRRIDKSYLGISARRPAKKMGLVAGDMVRSRDGNWRLTRGQQTPALTSFVSAAAGEGRRVIWLKPWTGRTHQLRVAMKAVGAPLLGDLRYGGAPARRLALHAWTLSFLWQGETVHCLAPLPTDDVAWTHPVLLAQAQQWLALQQAPDAKPDWTRPAGALLARVGMEDDTWQ